MGEEIEELRDQLAETRAVIVANAGYVAALRAAICALIFTHPDLPRYEIALKSLLDSREAVLNGEGPDEMLEKFQATRTSLEEFVAEGLAERQAESKGLR